jgi:hypothetical protein
VHVLFGFLVPGKFVLEIRDGAQMFGREIEHYFLEGEVVRRSAENMKRNEDEPGTSLLWQQRAGTRRRC